MNVAPHPPRPLRRPLPPRPPSPTQGNRSILHKSPVTNHQSRPSPSRTDLHESRITSHESRFGKSFRFRSYRNPARNPFKIRSYKNTGGWRCLAYNPVYRSGSVSLCPSLPRPGRGGKSTPALHNFGAPITTFRINTCISVASKRLYLPLESPLTKKGGEGGIPARVRQSTINRRMHDQSQFLECGTLLPLLRRQRTRDSIEQGGSQPAQLAPQGLTTGYFGRGGKPL